MRQALVSIPSITNIHPVCITVEFGVSEKVMVDLTLANKIVALAAVRTSLFTTRCLVQTRCSGSVAYLSYSVLPTTASDTRMPWCICISSKGSISREEGSGRGE
ncbi:hypothetical protein E4U26_007470 [Claviceps purpurea]|nr:hypothetical protein E4U26_007470 [Claviceps purpurea]